jgi:hypothetical protein
MNLSGISIFFFSTLAWLVLSCDHIDEYPCTRKATVVDMGLGCGFGFELEDGTRLQHMWQLDNCVPRKEDANHPLTRFKYVAGKRVLIGYDKVKTGSCPNTTPVFITCIQQLQAVPQR